MDIRKALSGTSAVILTIILTATICWADLPALDLDSTEAMRENLRKMSEKVVTLKLSSGEEISGKVTQVGKSAVHLSSLTGKEFYDAVVPISEVVALVMRAKG